MAANLSPEYKQAQEAYRGARDPHERLECLKEMLRTIPKHKGTEHLQADLRTRIREVTEEISVPHKGSARVGPALTVRPEGAGQVALLGAPNVGKSSLHARLTHSHAAVGPYPFTTKIPLPGMLAVEDVHLQIVDLPPVSLDVMDPWLPNTLQTADAALLVVDLGVPDCVEQAQAVVDRLSARRITLLLQGEAPPVLDAESDESLDPFRRWLPTAVVATRSDLLADPAAELAAFQELSGFGCPMLTVSAETGAGLDGLGPLLFRMLRVVRVYTKLPGHHPEHDRPFTVHAGDTVRDVARLVHRGRAAELKFARLWGSARFEGEQVSADHAVRDGDIVELHW